MRAGLEIRFRFLWKEVSGNDCGYDHPREIFAWEEIWTDYGHDPGNTFAWEGWRELESQSWFFWEVIGTDYDRAPQRGICA